jgi:hypothetical protein
MVALIARNMLEEEVFRNELESEEVPVLVEAGAAEVGDATTDAADPVLEAGVSCPFNPGVTCEVTAAPAEDVVEPVGTATVLDDPVEPTLDCVSKVDDAVEDPDIGPVVEVDTRELETRAAEDVVELVGAN